MKKIAAFILTIAAIAATGPSNVTIYFKWLPDNTQMAGLSTNDYCTNLSMLVLSTPNVAVPTNLWPVVATIPVSPLLSQGPPGTTWSTVLQMDGQSRFYAVVMTNQNGGTSPFSNLAPGLTPPAAGTIPQPLKVQ